VSEPQELTTAREERSSIELDRNAKGVYRWAIRLYFDRADDDEGALLAQLNRLDAAHRRQYAGEQS
jgi:hypothetical protein